MRYDTIVIGAGLSGLTSALLLARSGRKVLVLEQHPKPAPVISGFSRNGLYFDSGFHYAGGLGENGAFRPLFRHLGLESKLRLTPFADDGFDRLRFANSGETFALPVGFAAIKESLASRFPEVARGIERYLDELEAGWSRFPYLDLESDFADFAMPSVHGVTLHERLAEFSEHPELLGLLSMHTLLYGVPAESAPLALNTQVAGSYYHSVHAINGGGRALADALLELLADAGAEVRCRAEVSSINADHEGVTGVSLADGEQITGSNIVATINPVLLPQLLPEGLLRPAYRKRLAGLRQTCSAYILFARSQAAAGALRGSNLFVKREPGLVSPQVDRSLTDRAYYLAAAGDGNGHKGLVGIIPARFDEVADWADCGRQRSDSYRQHKEKIGEQLLQQVSRDNPELSDLELLELATPLTLRDYSCAPQGAIYGIGRFNGQYNPHPATRLRGLYLGGQAIAAPGLLGCVVASYLTCGSILGHETLRGEIRACH